MGTSTDQKILRELEKNSRASNIDIATKLSISEGTVRNRIKKLIKGGVIKRFTIDLSTKNMFFTFVLIKTDPNVKTSIIVNKIKKMKAIKNIFECAGGFDIIIKVITNSASDFNDMIEKIRGIKGILDTETLTILKVS